MKAYHGDAWATVIIRKEITFDEQNNEEIFLDGSNNASILVNTIRVQELIQLVISLQAAANVRKLVAQLEQLA